MTRHPNRPAGRLLLFAAGFAAGITAACTVWAGSDMILCSTGPVVFLAPH
ncbi:hypothetical protein [Nocardiopsis mwathae]|nr:hypothetical protein [Nocardiopsis mwathae]